MLNNPYQSPATGPVSRIRWSPRGFSWASLGGSLASLAGHKVTHLLASLALFAYAQGIPGGRAYVQAADILLVVVWALWGVAVVLAVFARRDTPVFRILVAVGLGAAAVFGLVIV